LVFKCRANEKCMVKPTDGESTPYHSTRNILHTLAFVFPSYGLLKIKENIKSFYLELQCRKFACPNSDHLTEKFQVYKSSQVYSVFLVASSGHH
jgi:hypothetical protein